MLKGHFVCAYPKLGVCHVVVFICRFQAVDFVVLHFVMLNLFIAYYTVWVLLIVEGCKMTYNSFIQRHLDPVG